MHIKPLGTILAHLTASNIGMQRCLAFLGRELPLDKQSEFFLLLSKAMEENSRAVDELNKALEDYA